MFDKTSLAITNTSPETVHVHEHRAPTDESVRLLMEMEEAARDKITSVANLKSTNFEFNIQFVEDFCNLSVIAFVIFKLNDKKHILRMELDWEVQHLNDAEELVKILRERLSTYLTNYILPEIATETSRYLFSRRTGK